MPKFFRALITLTALLSLTCCATAAICWATVDRRVQLFHFKIRASEFSFSAATFPNLPHGIMLAISQDFEEIVTHDSNSLELEKGDRYMGTRYDNFQNGPFGIRTRQYSGCGGEMLSATTAQEKG